MYNKKSKYGVEQSIQASCVGSRLDIMALKLISLRFFFQFEPDFILWTFGKNMYTLQFYTFVYEF